MNRNLRRLNQKKSGVAPVRPSAALSEMLADALRCHQAGQVAEAERGYHQILAIDAGHADALHLLGMIAYQQGRPDIAADLIGRAIDRDGDRALFHCNLGNANYALGRVEAAAAAFRRAIALNADYAEAHSNLGVALMELGHPQDAVNSLKVAAGRKGVSPDVLYNLGNALQAAEACVEAVAAYRRAIALQPGFALAFGNLGNALENLQRMDAAIAAHRIAVSLAPDDAGNWYRLGNALEKGDEDVMALFRRALVLEPCHGRTLNNLGELLRNAKRSEEAVAVLARSIVMLSGEVGPYNNLGLALQDLQRPAEAFAAFRTALGLEPDFAGARSNAAQLLIEQGRIEDGLRQAAMAVALEPDLADSYTNLGKGQQSLGALNTAMTLHQRAMAIDPERPLLRNNAAHTLLCLGRLAEAWQAYDSRPFVRQFPAIPAWDGACAPESRLLVWKEQGVADQMVAVSMINDAARKVGHVVLECDPRLVTLFARSFPGVTVVPERTPLHPLAETADIQIPLYSLGKVFRNDPADFPDHSGYLKPDTERVAFWKGWLATLGDGPKIGFSWRSMSAASLPYFLPPLDSLAPLLALPGFAFVNLQYGPSEEEIEAFMGRTGLRIHSPPGLNLTDDFDDLAALVQALDCAVGTTSSSLILASAVGRPTLMYVFYPAHNENRMLGQAAMPWFPSAQSMIYGVGEDLDGLCRRFAGRFGEFVSCLRP